MRIGFDAKRAFLNTSGLGNYSRNALLSLKNYFPDNKYVLFTPEIKKDIFPQYKEFDIISPDSPVAKIFKSLWRSFSVSGQLKNNEIDIFHGLSNELPDGIHKTKVPSIVTVHDIIFMRFPEFYKPIDRKIYYRKVKYACTVATKVLAISEQTKEDLVDFLNIDPGKIEVIHQAISSVFFDDHQEDVLNKYHLPEKYILSVGTIEKRKNQLAILQALHKAKIDIPVVFVGKPTLYSTKLLKFITDNKLDDKVHFLNKIPEKDLAGIYKKAQLSIYISYFEGFGLPVIESMACACPVITSNVSCLPETAGDAAILCPPSDIDAIGKSLKELLNDNSLREALIEKGLTRAKQFQPELYSQNLISLYSKLLS